MALLLTASACDEIMPKRTPGEKLYRKHCGDCHGLDARGQTIMYMGQPYADLTDDVWRHGGDAYGMEQTLREGLVFRHPSYEEFSTQQLRQIIDHVLALRGERR